MGKVISIENLSKKYSLYHEGQAAYSTLVETLSSKARHFYQKILYPTRRQHDSCFEEFWALKDISFDIEEGDKIGIIGRNGAGKSTLLKILSRITEPTQGKISIKGRLASLLEVGTGFHQELTGRENIYLNGAILGMKQSEIRKKFDEIVAFAEVEQFLDTPVKRFSSGMYMRLGFAIAAHLDAEILIIDEVLAVGDTQFQSKCFRKLNDLGSQGRTVLFVSHDLGSVLSLCNRGLYLEKGRVVEAGSIDACVDKYMRSYRDRALSWQGVVGDEHISITHASLEGGKEFFYQGEQPTLHIEYEILKPHPDLFLSIGVCNKRNQVLARSQTFDDVDNFDAYNRVGKHSVSFAIDTRMFHEGEYLVKVHCDIFNKKKICDEEIVLKFPVYAQTKNTRFAHAIEKEGIYLGNQWQRKTHG